VGKLHQIGNATLRVYASDHLPPHFHIVSPDYEVLVAIETGAPLRGLVGDRNGRAILGWAAANRNLIASIPAFRLSEKE
jgi:hypothetical protein